MLFLATGSAGAEDHTSPLRLTTPDQQLQSSFEWAKRQALAYVSSGHDPVQYFIESALPGRDAFCMRDVSHQVMGAEALGFAVQNKSMLTLFAKNISNSKDWAGYWEIDAQGKPSPADYVSDMDFWYNLPANFDVMAAALRMYMWTGDTDYIRNPIFLNFYKHSLTNYIQRWQLGPRNILSRQRIMNHRLQSGKFVHSRGIPSYTEGRVDFNVGTDLLAAEYRALRWYAELLRMRGDAASATGFDKEASGIAHVLETSAWDAGDQHFYGFLKANGHPFGTGDPFILYFHAAVEPQQRAASFSELKQLTREPDPGIEEQSYRPEILFRYGDPEDARRQILDLSRPDRKRREYPEVSYAVIGSLVTGMMGVAVLPADRPADDLLGNEVVIRTLPRLSAQTPSADLDNLPVRRNVIDVRHTGNRSSSVTNVSGPRFTWRATFDGSASFLRVDGRKVRSRAGETPEGMPVIYTDVSVAPGQTATVSE